MDRGIARQALFAVAGRSLALRQQVTAVPGADRHATQRRCRKGRFGGEDILGGLESFCRSDVIRSDGIGGDRGRPVMIVIRNGCMPGRRRQANTLDTNGSEESDADKATQQCVRYSVFDVLDVVNHQSQRRWPRRPFEVLLSANIILKHRSKRYSECLVAHAFVFEREQ